MMNHPLKKMWKMSIPRPIDESFPRVMRRSALELRVHPWGCTDGSVDGRWMDRPVEYDLPLDPPSGCVRVRCQLGWAGRDRGVQAGLCIRYRGHATHPRQLDAGDCIFWGNGHVTLRENDRCGLNWIHGGTIQSQGPYP